MPVNYSREIPSCLTLKQLNQYPDIFHDSPHFCCGKRPWHFTFDIYQSGLHLVAHLFGEPLFINLRESPLRNCVCLFALLTGYPAWLFIFQTIAFIIRGIEKCSVADPLGQQGKVADCKIVHSEFYAEKVN